MILAPFDSRCADWIMKFYHDADYSHFNRDVGRYLTLEECQSLPEVLRSEVLMIIDESFMGLAVIKYDLPGVYEFNLVLSKENQKKGLSYKALDLIHDYVFRVKGGRLLLTGIVSRDEWRANILSKKGYSLVGRLPEYACIDGQLEDISIFYKKR